MAYGRSYSFSNQNRANYYIGGSSTDRLCLTEELVATELTADAASGATTITVDSITGISASDIIGVVTDEDGIDWTTVSGAPSGSTITLTASLDGAASSGNRVYTYTNAFSHKALKIRHAFRRDSNNIDIPLNIWSHQEYNGITNKGQTGSILSIYADPQRDEMQLYTWPIASDADLDTLMYLSIQRTIYDFDASSDNPDFPQEWFLALAFNTAMYAAPVYGVSETRFNRIASIATNLKKDLLDWSTEDTSIFIVPNLDRY
jgi:hypothetical protein